MRVRVIDLDGAVANQPYLAGLVEAGEAERIDACDLEQRLRILASRRAFRMFGERLGEGAANGEPEVLFFGSGDFHHLTAAFVARHPEPLAIIHFDNHPDWVRYPTINCGSWVNMALRSPNVAKVVTIGPCSDDLQNPEWKFANLPAMREGRLAVYPWRSSPTRLWGAAVSTASAASSDGRLTWRNLADESWADFLDELAGSLPVSALWITIDKDVLTPAEAVTNWDQGEMTLDHIAAALQRLASSFKIVGIDVCGALEWASSYELLFPLNFERAECLYLAGRFDDAERAHAPLYERAASKRDQAAVHELRVTFFENRSRYAEAVASGREGLSLFGITFPDEDQPIQQALQIELETIQRLLGDRPIRSLAALTEMDDHDVRTAMRLLTLMWAPVYISGLQRLTSLISATMVRLSIQHGNTEDSAYGYVTHAITVGPVERR